MRFLLVLLIILITPPAAFARVTPASIYQDRLEVYEKKLANYSPENKQKLEELRKRIEELNYKRTTELKLIALRQGEILDEHIARNKIEERILTDGINRNLSDPVENARYWITYGHEAVAFQETKYYIPVLTSEKNIKQDALNMISLYQSELNSSRTKVLNSQKLLDKLLKE